MAVKEEKKEAQAEGEKVKLSPGFHVGQGSKHIAGPYPTEADAQEYINSHLDGDGEVVEVSSED